MFNHYDLAQSSYIFFILKLPPCLLFLLDIPTSSGTDTALIIGGVVVAVGPLVTGGAMMIVFLALRTTCTITTTSCSPCTTAVKVAVPSVSISSDSAIIALAVQKWEIVAER